MLTAVMVIRQFAQKDSENNVQTLNETQLCCLVTPHSSLNSLIPFLLCLLNTAAECVPYFLESNSH
jgi:hypothetical protein